MTLQAASCCEAPSPAPASVSTMYVTTRHRNTYRCLRRFLKEKKKRVRCDQRTEGLTEKEKSDKKAIEIVGEKGIEKGADSGGGAGAAAP